VVSRNFYWVPGTLTTFDWSKTDYTHTPAARHEDLTALAICRLRRWLLMRRWRRPRGRELRVELENPSAALAFQVSAAVRTQSGGLIAPVIWSDNWIELVPGEKRVLTALLPDGCRRVGMRGVGCDADDCFGADRKLEGKNGARKPYGFRQLKYCFATDDMARMS
jgi:hypothetical protein